MRYKIFQSAIICWKYKVLEGIMYFTFFLDLLEITGEEECIYFLPEIGIVCISINFVPVTSFLVNNIIEWKRVSVNMLHKM